MTCDELRDLYELYALGALEPEERAEIDAHLDRQCDSCTNGIKRAAVTNAILTSMSPDKAPSSRLRKRIMSSVGAESRSWGWLAGWGAVTAALTIGLLWMATESNQRSGELTTARNQIVDMQSQLTRVKQVVDFMNAPGTRLVNFGDEQKQPPRGKVLVHATNGILMLASNLPQLERGKTYEMWVIPKGGAPRPAGLFQSDQSGSAIYRIPGPVDPTTTAVAVSVEPEAGSTAPTTTPIIVAPVAGL